MFSELSEKEFNTFAKKHELGNFHQTTMWGELKKSNGWKYSCVGIKEKDKIVCAALLLYKKVPVFNNYIFYSPRGFLIDFSNYRLLKKFTLELKKYIKNKKGIFIKIDPYLIYKERDAEGKIIKSGINNTKALNNLLKLDYTHHGFNLYYETLQPRWLYTINIFKKTEEHVLNEMSFSTKQNIRKSEDAGFKPKILKREELKIFKDIMEHTSDRVGFIDRPLKYYEEMYDTLKDNIIFLVIEFNIKEAMQKNKHEIKELEKELSQREQDKEKPNINKKKNDNRIELIKKNLKSLNRKKETYLEYSKNKEIIYLAGKLFITYGNEVLSLFGGAYKPYSIFKPSYALNWEMIKYAINNKYKKVNLYGITGDFNEKSDSYGLYAFKKSFGGQVEELIGEFDLVVNKSMYFLYNISMRIYGKLRKIKNSD